MTGLYLHFPFCTRKCVYCDFVSYGGRESAIGAYLDRLKREAEGFKGEKLDTVYLGGGTPSLMEPEQISDLLAFLKRNFELSESAEITVEGNPASVTKEKLEALKSGGGTRVSLGAQSLTDETLKALGRCHSLSQLEQAVRYAKEVKLSLNLDLIFALPGQTRENWRETVKHACAFSPDHVSCYSLTVSDKTPLGRRVKCGELSLPDEELERAMYHDGEELLARAGIEPYEISNYARPGKECRHNIGYWECFEYLGLGVAAHGYYRGARYAHSADLDAYLHGEDTVVERTVLSRTDKIEERLMLGLRMNRGLDVRRFEHDFSVDFSRAYARELDKLLRLSLIEYDGEFLRLTARGRDVCDAVALEFISREI